MLHRIDLGDYHTLPLKGIKPADRPVLDQLVRMRLVRIVRDGHLPPHFVLTNNGIHAMNTFKGIIDSGRLRPLRVLARYMRAKLEHGYGTEGLGLSWQGPFEAETSCDECDLPARIFLVLQEDQDDVEPVAADLHPNNFRNDPDQGEPGFWFHDCAAFALYLCTNSDCAYVTVRWNQA